MFRFFVLLLLVASCTPKDQQISIAEEAHPLDTYFKSLLPADEPGAEILVMKSDSVVFSGAYGLSDLNQKTPMTTTTLLNLGSISKTFVASAILQLRDEGKLSLEDPLIKYFPEFKNKSIGQKVKLLHLLTHTSGLPDIRFPYQDSVFYLTAKDNENWEPILKAEKLNFEPGSRFEYSNPAFNALALIVEQVSGVKWQNYIREKILLPSNMDNSTITDGPHPESGVAHGYIFSRGQWLEKDYGEEPTFAASGNGGVWSSVEELAHYEQAIQQAKFLSAETILESRTVKNFTNWADSTKSQLGWSWFITSTKQNYQAIGHTGSQGGFRANYVFIPEKQWFIVLLSTTPRPLEEMTSHIIDYLDSVGSNK
jgi:hypothetical protein